MKQRRIVWRPRAGGSGGSSQWMTLARPLLMEMTVDHLNRAYPELEHWIEERDGPATTTTDESEANDD